MSGELIPCVHDKDGWPHNDPLLKTLLVQALAIVSFVSENYQADCGDEDVKDRVLPEVERRLTEAIEAF